MKRVRLHRYLYDDDFGTFGRLQIEGLRIWTIEKPWRDNQRNISCIPADTYECAPGWFNRGGYECIDVLDVPDRSQIKFHIANLGSEVEGCIGSGMYRGALNGQWAVLDSKSAHEYLMAQIGQDGFKLIITGKPL